MSEATAKQYESMLVELMDPTKAFKSNNIAVRTAATQLYSSDSSFTGDLGEAFQVLLNSTNNVMSKVIGSNSVQTAYGAGAMGLDPMTAMYKPESYTGVSMIYAGDIEQSAQEQIDKLSENAYTTKQEQEENILENSDFTQTVAGFAKEFPQLYKQMSGMTIAAITAAGSGLTHWISDKLTGGAFTLIHIFY